MKKKFSTAWKASRQTRKQRKYRANAPLHIRHKFMGAHLSKELRKKYGMRNIALRKGDKVKVMRGGFAGKEGKIEKVNLKKMTVLIEGIQRQKKDGSKVGVKFQPSKLLIQELNLDDTQRMIKTKQKEEKKNAPKKT